MEGGSERGKEREREREKKYRDEGKRTPGHGGTTRRAVQGKRTKNEVKFIRVQTDVNLFKLRDFDRGFIVARRERLYLLYHCVGQGMGVDRS